jgi:predicted metal-dependent hydrolase
MKKRSFQRHYNFFKDKILFSIKYFFKEKIILGIKKREKVGSDKLPEWVSLLFQEIITSLKKLLIILIH